jgi:hypothetical protein
MRAGNGPPAAQEIRRDDERRAFAAAAEKSRPRRQACESSARRERRAAHVKLIGEQQALAGKFGVLVADPPWPWEAYSEETGVDRSPDNHHATMSLEDITAMPVASIAADDAGLSLWGRFRCCLRPLK